MTILIPFVVEQDSFFPCILCSSDKAGGDDLGAGDRRTDDYGGGTQLEGGMDFVGLCDVAFYEHRDCQIGQDGLNERQRDGALVGGLGGVTVEGRGDGIGSGLLGGEGVLEGGDVGENGAVEFAVDTRDQLGPGFSGGEAPSGAVEGDDICSCFADGFGGAEVGCDVDLAVSVVGLDDADDGKLRDSTEGSDARHPFGTKAASSAAKNRGCDAGQRIEIVQRVALGGLAGDDDASAKRLDGRVSRGIRDRRHVETFLMLPLRCREQLIALSCRCLLLVKSRYRGLS